MRTFLRRGTGSTAVSRDAVAAAEAGSAAASTAGSAPSDTGASAAARSAGTTAAAGKGRATPKRKDAQTRRRLVEPPPTDRKEAYKRMRGRQKEERATAREGMQRGDQRYLLARDRGSERKLVRDLVDSRRNVGTWFFAGAFLVIIFSSGTWPAQVRLAANLLWITMVVLLVLDSVLIARTLKREVTARHPGTTEKMGSLYFYGITRATMFRRLRSPRPAVKPGDKV